MSSSSHRNRGHPTVMKCHKSWSQSTLCQLIRAWTLPKRQDLNARPQSVFLRVHPWLKNKARPWNSYNADVGVAKQRQGGPLRSKHNNSDGRCEYGCKSGERLGELSILSATSPGMLIDDLQLSQTVVRRRAEFQAGVRLRACQCEEPPEIELVCRCQTERDGDPDSCGSPITRLVCELMTCQMNRTTIDG